MHKLDESLLAPLPPFSKLSKVQIREILDAANSRLVPVGTAVFEEGDTADQFFLLLDGTIRVVRITQDGEQVISLHIPAGQLFGIAPAIGRDTYPATAMAASELLILCWPTRLWSKFVAQYDGFATQTYKIVGKRVNDMNDRIVEMATQHVEQRIACALLRLINQSGVKLKDGSIEVGFPVTRQDVAQMTGTTLHTVSRLLSAWEKTGVVSSKRKKIVVRQPHQMVLLSGADG